MPVKSCSDDGNPGFKWGDSGKCYIYTAGDEKSMNEAKRKATIQGIATGEYTNKKEVISTLGMPSGLKNPQQGYGRRINPRDLTEEDLNWVLKNLREWFNEEWVDISRPKEGGGFEPCGRSDASQGRYPKCVPASRAARMTQEEIDSAVRRKRRAESTQRRDGKKPIYVPTEKRETINVPTNRALYSRVKSEAKRRFDVYPSAYANAWLVREYKRRGGGYRTVNKGEIMDKMVEDLSEQEAALHDALIMVADNYGKFDNEGSGIWVGYESAEENDDKDIGVNCKNCTLYAGEGVCKILNMQVEEYGKCRFAIIPDGVVVPEVSDDVMEEEDENSSYLSILIDIIEDILNNKGERNEV